MKCHIYDNALIETIPKDNIATLNCEKKKEVITIEEVLLGGNVPQTHPDLVPQKMTDECYAQWVNELNNGRSKKVKRHPSAPGLIFFSPFESRRYIPAF